MEETNVGKNFKRKSFEKQNLGEKVGEQKFKSKNLRSNLGIKILKITFGEKNRSKKFWKHNFIT